MLQVFDVQKKDKEVKKILSNAFPMMGIMFSHLIKMARESDNEFVAFKEDGKIIGFTHNIILEDILYVYFLGIDEKSRSKGYGSKILAWIEDKYPNHRICLNMEQVNEKASNSEQRLRRELFYHKNGFDYVGIVYGPGTFKVELLSFNDAHISLEEYHEIVKIMMGKFLYAISKWSIKKTSLYYGE